MRNKIGLYLVVAILAYGAGTFSSLQAEAPAKIDTELMSKINEKLDKILSNQEEMKSTLKKIVVRV